MHLPEKQNKPGRREFLQSLGNNLHTIIVVGFMQIDRNSILMNHFCTI
jgi:hypothetical protein